MFRALLETRRVGVLLLLLVLSVAVIGIGGTFGIGQQVKSNAINGWKREAGQNVATATVAAESWLAQVEALLKGIAVMFRGAQQVPESEFLELVLDAEEWNSEFSLQTVAVTQRLMRRQRVAFEAARGTPITVVGRPDETAPQVYESFVVVNSSDEKNGLLIGSDLTTRPEMGVVVSTAYRVPNQVILGPVYERTDEQLISLAGLRIENGEAEGVLVAEINISMMIDYLITSRLPAGIQLRLAERDTETRASRVLRSVYGALQAGPDVLHTVPVRISKGQARWDFYWDILPDYLGGPPTAIGVTIQVGGLLLTVLAITTIGFLSYQNAIIRHKVEERTVSLVKMKEEADAANRAKSDFLASVSHELRTPMNAMLGFAQLLRMDNAEPLTEKQDQYVGRILKGGGQLFGLIEQILELNKIDARELPLIVDYVDPVTAIRHSLGMVTEQAKQRSIELIDQTIDQDLPALWTDQVRLTQVLVNLLLNGIKYNHDDGQVTLSVDTSTVGRLRICVKDTGDGIQQDKWEGLFQPFNRLGRESGSIEGAGVGLATSKKIVDILGGQIDFHSVVGEGSTFWVEIPIVHDAITYEEKMAVIRVEAAERREKSRRDPSSVVILYVEGNPEAVELMEQVVRMLPRTTMVVAYDVELGLTMARKHLPDLILVDLNLPDMDGHEMLGILRTDESTKHIPVIAVSADATYQDVEKCLHAGFLAYFTKPYNLADIQSLIGKYTR